MEDELEKGNYKPRVKLDAKERMAIRQRIEADSFKFTNILVKMGFLANTLTGFFFLIASYHNLDHSRLYYWYISLIILNLVNILWSGYFEGRTKSEKHMLLFHSGNLVVIAMIGLIWGSIGVLFFSSDQNQQIITIIFLLLAVIYYAFAASINLWVGLIGTTCIIAPSILFHLSFLNPFVEPAMHHAINISIANALTIVGLFTFASCFIANKTVMKILHLSYENNLLQKRMEGLNNYLEKRVRIRTQELEKSLALVTYQSTHDLLTGLPNERLLYEEANKAVQDSFHDNLKFAVATFTINGKGMVSNSIGHEAGNEVTKKVGQRFLNMVSHNSRYFASLSRQDVFVVLIKGVKNLKEAEHFASTLFSLLNEPVYVSNQKLKLTASIGLSLFPEHGGNLNTLISNAGSAGSIAAHRGGNSLRVYESLLNADSHRQLNLENQLYSVIQNDELLLHFQPFIDLDSGTVCGAEALVRWKSPTLGLVSPAEFIPLAEANGMIIPIGEWVLRTACEQVKILQKQGINELRVSLNISARQLIQSNLVEIVENALREYQVDPKHLEFELTESNAFKDEAIPVLNKIVDMGISLSIDDFGTGFSEFSSLKLFKVSKIKIDKSFVDDIDINADSRNIVINTISLARSMGIECVAEGVETLEQVRFLKKHGCHLMQGYYFSKPLNPEDFIRFLKNRTMHFNQG